MRHRRPKLYPYPNAFAHPLPRFYYSSITKQILVEFECDPSYHATMSLSAEGNFGFPSGYFVIRSLATGRVLDIELDDVSDGAEAILWPEKETSLVEGE